MNAPIALLLLGSDNSPEILQCAFGILFFLAYSSKV
jgi:hypothetical protein